MRTKNVLIISSNSSLAEKAVECLVNGDFFVGLHYSENKDRIRKYLDYSNVCFIEKKIETEKDCIDIVDVFIEKTSHVIDNLVVMTGGCKKICSWNDLVVQDMMDTFFLNAVIPFICAKNACNYMSKGGNIVFVSTASAKCGGGRNTLAYGMGKSALECCMKRLAKDLAVKHIAVNAIAPGYIDTESQKSFKTKEEVEKRISLIPMKKSGNCSDFADLLLYFLIDNSFMTGQVITLDGGDFI